MPKITKRELKRMRTRLEFIFRKLDGKPPAAEPGSADEFTAAQNHVKEQIITARSRIQQKLRVEKKGSVVEIRKAKNELGEAMNDLDDSMAKLKTVLGTVLDSPKVPQTVKEERSRIVEKFEDLVRNLTVAATTGSGDVLLAPKAKQVDKLSDLKGRYKDLDAHNTTRNDMLGDDNPDDERVLGEWRAEDEKIDNKLNDVNLILDEIRTMNDNLKHGLELREAVIDDANRDAQKANRELTVQNKQLANVLRKIRSPGKFCLDVCLFLVLLGLVAVIVMLALNGKSA